ncbi:hypothetical protein MKW92_049158 [Papaver armeniacum]|nr:hypothetical protein MKW92_049158 [Papaver armeniacum]
MLCWRCNTKKSKKTEREGVEEEEVVISPQIMNNNGGTTTISASEQAELCKKDGNFKFSKERFAAAIEAYTQAITLCPDVPVYWTNRALCHRKREEWERAEEDCRKALELDSNSTKAHYILGLALLQRVEYAEGVQQLEKALDLGRGANPTGYMVEEIWQELAKAKYLEWEHASSQRSWRQQNLKEKCENALEEQYLLDASQGDVITEEAQNTHSENLHLLDQVFKKAAEDDTPFEVPDYLCCQITLDIFRDPVITPSGVTYERKVLLDHLQKVGKFDPITRETLDPRQLIPNLAIKEAVRVFLKKHGWAYKLD